MKAAMLWLATSVSVALVGCGGGTWDGIYEGTKGEYLEVEDDVVVHLRLPYAVPVSQGLQEVELLDDHPIDDDTLNIAAEHDGFGITIAGAFEDETAHGTISAERADGTANTGMPWSAALQ